MSKKKRKRLVNKLFLDRFHNPNFFRSTESGAWENVAPVGRELGSPDYERLMQQDRNHLRSNLSRLIAQCSDADTSITAPSYVGSPQDAINVQAALRELGQDVSIAVAAAVWRHHSNSLMAGWMSGAETVASAKGTILLYCTQNPTGSL